ncbi:DUF2236 domain-containing protein [Epidermidibacterium keratini]|uniref:DUF2236 domain-containing protein n=1 Tax=Epidermidibacterium keratini TaxID=1891644 RepID=A0A7L4YMQ8_9ACTN|nr:oxygenase MpaB family protein [Epidermidibacterium keratini]QHC00368.1 DUF2236 domain-containing protein [Epidermidibacterium keratini]
MLHDTRRAVAGALRSRVVGPDAAQRAAEIWQKPGPRRFTASDPIWRVHADSSMFIGGIRALLLQALHPLAMAGVADHSDYRGDPWGRLQRTSGFIATTTYAVDDDADRAVRIVRAVHKRVHGRTRDGREYDASDPHLLMWVHVAEIDSFLAAHQLFGKRPLTDDEADRYVAQTGATARALGVLDPPRSVAELADVLALYRPELESTPEAREVAKFLMLRPPLPLPLVPAYSLLSSSAAGSLPSWALRMLHLPHVPRVTSMLTRPAGRLGASGVRWLMSSVDLPEKHGKKSVPTPEPRPSI